VKNALKCKSVSLATFFYIGLNESKASDKVDKGYRRSHHINTLECHTLHKLQPHFVDKNKNALKRRQSSDYFKI